jgi:hypothetical protein
MFAPGQQDTVPASGGSQRKELYELIKSLAQQRQKSKRRDDFCRNLRDVLERRS